jgi:LmbE family N-acetylglucosaminyl deacetylase
MKQGNVPAANYGLTLSTLRPILARPEKNFKQSRPKRGSMAAENLRLMCVLAHPDDESLGTGGTLAKYNDEGVETFIVTATRGERGRFGDTVERPGPEEVGRVREAELRAAAQRLGTGHVSFLDYLDADLDKADPGEASAKIAAHLRTFKPQVVITFGPDGGYGHPDHIAISQLTGAAIVNAADASYQGTPTVPVRQAPYRVAKLYYIAWTAGPWEAYQAAFKDLKITVDGVERRATPAPDWLVTTRLDTRKYWQQVWEAVCCHRTQLTIYSKLRELPEVKHLAIWGRQEYYRVFSTVNGGRQIESDLFAGLR